MFICFSLLAGEHTVSIAYLETAGTASSTGNKADKPKTDIIKVQVIANAIIAVNFDYSAEKATAPVIADISINDTIEETVESLPDEDIVATAENNISTEEAEAALATDIEQVADSSIDELQEVQEIQSIELNDEDNIVSSTIERKPVEVKKTSNISYGITIALGYATGFLLENANYRILGRHQTGRRFLFKHKVILLKNINISFLYIWRL